MNDGTFCDFRQSINGNVINQIPENYSTRNGSNGFGGKLVRPNYYIDQYNQLEDEDVPQNLSMGMGASGPHDLSQPITTMAAGLYEPNMNIAMKPERNLPLTPPESPEESGAVPDMSHLSQAAGHMIHPAVMGAMVTTQQMLAKPPSMKGLSEKNIEPLRTSFNSSDSVLDPYAAAASANTAPTLARALAVVQQSQKRPRSEKKKIPDDSKDSRYFERRKRNNYAAKKSRDTRKAREDEIAIRASFLEKENAVLRAQVGTLREEANSLRQLLMQKQARH